MKTTAIVILNWNGVDYLNTFLPVLIQHTTQPGVDIYVADNASSDGSAQLLKERFDTVKTIFLDKNYGFAGGYNRALQQIKADFYVLLNSDVEVTQNWLTPLLDYMDQHPDIGACQPRLLSFNRRDYFEHAGAAGGVS